MNRLLEFVDSTYTSLARFRSFGEAVRGINTLVSRHTGADSFVFQESAEGAAAAQLCDGGTPSPDEVREIRAAAASVIQVSLNTLVLGRPALVVPIIAGGGRLGVLVAIRGDEFSPEELMIGEAAASMLSANIRAIVNERDALEMKDASAVRAALGTLSYSELEAAAEVFRRLSADEGSIVASRIAAESGATRSAIVNALRKLESAGLLESHSMGVKGTFIKLRTTLLRDELRKFTK
ncbi:MAG: hypothetical protein FWD98_06210 [Defluviitaleaceae bacterium]|nr:hypothetical protein [Defluviitaleaceae bacterium]